MTHPDKGTEMFLYELGVDESARRQGVGRTLVQALAALAREQGCYDMWVLADADNEAAQATYTRAGGARGVAAGAAGVVVRGLRAVRAALAALRGVYCRIEGRE